MDTENKIPETEIVTEPQNDLQQEETQEQINWKKFRQQKEADEKRAKEAEERAAKAAAEAAALKEAIDALLNKPQGSNEADDDDEDKKLERKLAAILKQKEEKERREREERERQEFPNKLRTTYNDFDHVCTKDNLLYLEYHYPEVTKAFQHMPDGFDKWASVYQAVKRLIPNSNSKKEEKKIEQNLNKPQSINAGLAQTGDTTPRMVLDEKKKADNWLRMRRAIKGV